MKDVLKALNDINSNYKIIDRFVNGMSNYTFLIEDENAHKFVYRYPGEKNEEFVNYQVLQSNLHEIEKLNITNEVMYYNEDNGIKISKYIEGKTISENIDLSKVSDILKIIHTSKIKLNEYNHLKRLSKYEVMAKNEVSDYYMIKQQWIDIYEKHLKQHVKYPCHGDSQFSNILVTLSGELKLLDFEFSAMNDYIYDIASFGNNDFDYAIKLLNEYEGSITNDKLIRLYGWRIFQCLQWYNVAKYKNSIGLSEKFNLDFNKISEKYLLLATNFLSDYEKIID